MSQHLSTETWTIQKKRGGSLLHIETSAECDNAGRHICSINKKDHRIAELIMVAPELLNLAYMISENRVDITTLQTMAKDIISRSFTK